ncbi:heavy metal-binding domain-containing protein [Brevibacillus agri]|uniref:heavy metal-binding domain-containing protein n=1 Tax=Brevibacillus agri TaxID=51101 RepID=UPI0004715A6C|nr:heavy metal-binding domain-containing protein [Brevibacillus agri]
MLVVTTENIPGYRIVEVKGTTLGLIVRARGIGGDIMAGLRSVVGGEIKEYTVLLEDARKQALDRMIKNANAMGANAIVMFRFDSGSMGNMGEVVAYGTAVVVEQV